VQPEQRIIVSTDSHATPPVEAFPDYVESKYHDLLPTVYEDNEQWVEFTGVFANFPPDVLAVMDPDGAWASGGFLGAWDLDRRLAEMDREGIAAELVFYGDPRAILPFGTAFRHFPQEVVAAGFRAYHRWIADAFGPARDRLLLVGDPASSVGMDGMLAELAWTADHGFAGATLPLMQHRPELPPLYDQYYERFWSMCEERGLALVCHAGFGSEQAQFTQRIDEIRATMEAAGRADLLSEMLSTEGFFTLDLRPRRAMWQMMLGGVFDRHPDLHLVMVEVRADWLPTTLRHLDAAYDGARGDVPAQRRPSEYWQANCMAAASFVHKAEVAMRHEIGIDTIAFGRDYPHAEGTWPNTSEWLADAFAGVPEAELRQMLGENAIRFFGLDRVPLEAVAGRIGPTVDDVLGAPPDVDPRIIEHWDARGGYLKPAEHVDPDAIDVLLDEDLVNLAARGAGAGLR
jgi:predicted TIM-barrel fold metal-dependent hydrolase